jgi:hypothetical protein
MSEPSGYLRNMAHREMVHRPDYFMHLQLPLPTLVIVAQALQEALKQARPLHVYPATIKTEVVIQSLIDHIIARMQDDALPYTANLLETLQS